MSTRNLSCMPTWSPFSPELLPNLCGKCWIPMEKYENLGVVGEGSYGVVIKCRHRQTGQVVAIKKFLETEDNPSVRKMALREIRMLKRLRHDNLVNMLEVFRRKKRFYIVFEFMDHTILDELEAKGGAGLLETKCREYIFQVVRGLEFCHSNNVMHRDIKPENVLVSNAGVIKLCDFGFARQLTGPSDAYTEYVATRWYRAPELLVNDPHYTQAVDIWAVGCLFAEIMTGDPLFPGDSDIDQLFIIMKMMGKLSQRHQQFLLRNPMYRGLKKSEEASTNLKLKFPSWTLPAIDFLECCLKMDPLLRPTSSELLRHLYLTKDNFPEKFLPCLRQKIMLESEGNPLLRKFQGSAPRPSREPRKITLAEVPRWKLNTLQDETKSNNSEYRTTIYQGNRTEPMEISTEDVENRREYGWDSIIPLSPHHPLPSVLLPTVSNIFLNCEPAKASPQLSHSKRHQGSKIQFKKLERSVENVPSAKNTWLAQSAPKVPCISRQRNHSRFGLDDELTLPNLPRGSPKKVTKKKSNFAWSGVLTPTPRNSQPPSAVLRSKHLP